MAPSTTRMSARAVLLAVVALEARAATFSVLDFGAKGDGITSDTGALRAALAAASAAGGGTVLLPRPYIFLTGAINLTSHVELRVEGTLLASPSSDAGNYVLVPPLPWYGGGQDAQQSGAPEWQAVVRSFGADNVSITGGGTLDGNGGASAGWWACFHAKPALAPAPCSGYSRPQLVRFVHTTNVLVSNLTVKNSPSWTIHLANVTGGVVEDVNVTAPADEGNTDGVDIDCSEDIIVRRMYYKGGDDAIAVKSGIDWLGYTYGRPTRNVLVTDLTVTSGNGIAIGSEQSAGIHNVTFDGVVVTASPGFPIKHGRWLRWKIYVEVDVIVHPRLDAPLFAAFTPLPFPFSCSLNRSIHEDSTGARGRRLRHHFSQHDGGGSQLRHWAHAIVSQRDSAYKCDCDA